MNVVFRENFSFPPPFPLCHNSQLKVDLENSLCVCTYLILILYSPISLHPHPPISEMVSSPSFLSLYTTHTLWNLCFPAFFRIRNDISITTLKLPTAGIVESRYCLKEGGFKVIQFDFDTCFAVTSKLSSLLGGGGSKLYKKAMRCGYRFIGSKGRVFAEKK